jgi:hypothetical protein
VRIRRIEPEDLEEFSEPHEVVHHERRARPRPDKGPDQPPKKKPSGRAPDTVSLIINLGKKDGMTRTRIADMVRKRAGLPDEAVGKVGLGEESSFVEVDAMTADAVIDCVDGTVCEGKDVTCDYAPEKESFEESVARKKKEKRRWRRFSSAARKAWASEGDIAKAALLRRQAVRPFRHVRARP